MNFSGIRNAGISVLKVCKDLIIERRILSYCEIINRAEIKTEISIPGFVSGIFS